MSIRSGARTNAVEPSAIASPSARHARSSFRVTGFPVQRAKRSGACPRPTAMFRTSMPAVRPQVAGMAIPAGMSYCQRVRRWYHAATLPFQAYMVRKPQRLWVRSRSTPKSSGTFLSGSTGPAQPLFLASSDAPDLGQRDLGRDGDPAHRDEGAGRVSGQPSEQNIGHRLRLQRLHRGAPSAARAEPAFDRCALARVSFVGSTCTKAYKITAAQFCGFSLFHGFCYLKVFNMFMFCVHFS